MATATASGTAGAATRSTVRLSVEGTNVATKVTTQTVRQPVPTTQRTGSLASATARSNTGAASRGRTSQARRAGHAEWARVEARTPIPASGPGRVAGAERGSTARRFADGAARSLFQDVGTALSGGSK
jgi:hypothetical protein